MAESINSLVDLIEKMADTAEHRERISLGEILESVGSRSLGPLLLVAGLITLAPIIGDIPGVPTLMATLVLLIAAQLLVRRQQLWLPQWLLKRSVAREKMQRVLEWSRKPAGFIDRYTRPRLARLVEGRGEHLVAIVCIFVALMMPLMEFVPFSANFAGLALSAFGMALISRDGALALVALAVLGLLLGFIVYQLL